MCLSVRRTLCQGRFCGVQGGPAEAWGGGASVAPPLSPVPSRKPRRVAERSAVGRGRCGPVPPHSGGGVLGSGQAAARPAMWGPAAAAGGTSWSGGGRFPGTWAWGAGPRGAGRAERARAMAAAGGAEPVC